MAKTMAAMVLAFGFLVPNAMGQTDYPAKPVKVVPAKENVCDA